VWTTSAADWPRSGGQPRTNICPTGCNVVASARLTGAECTRVVMNKHTRRVGGFGAPANARRYRKRAGDGGPGVPAGGRLGRRRGASAPGLSSAEPGGCPKRSDDDDDQAAATKYRVQSGTRSDPTYNARPCYYYDAIVS